MKRFLLGLTVLLVAFGLAGCGGNGSSNDNQFLKFQIAWGVRGARAIDAPNSALSFELMIFQEHQGTPPNSISVRGKRDRARLEAHIQTFQSTAIVSPGQYFCNVTFYANEDHTGAVVGTANAIVNIATDGSGIGTIAVANTIVRIDIPGGQTINVGQRKPLVVEPRDSLGNLVVVSPGSFVCSCTVTNVRFEGAEMVGVTSGLNVPVSVRADGITGTGLVTVN